MKNCKEAQEELGKWKIGFEGKPVDMKGRTLKPETIVVGKGKSVTYKVDKAEENNLVATAK